MIHSVHSWPDSNTFDGHVTGYEPLYVLGATQSSYPCPEHLTSLECEVDICSIEESEGDVYYGDVVRREHLRMKISSFSDGFIARERKEHHWIHDVGLNLYLSQATLFSTCSTEPIQVTGLEHVIERPQPLSSGRYHTRHINLWMNISPARTGLHYDQYHNILVLSRGRKVVSLVSPKHLKATRPIYLLTGGGANHSSASSAAELLATGSLQPEEVHVFDLSPGDAIFIPEGWWHDVKSDECSMALNFWFQCTVPPTNCNLHRSIVSGTPHMTPYILRSTFQDLIAEEMCCTVELYRRTKRPSSNEVDSMSDEQFAIFMDKLHRRYITSVSLPISDTSATTASCASQSSPQLIERDCMEDSLVLCSNDTMVRLWPAYAKNNPVSFGSILSELRPIASFSLTDSWDKFTVLEETDRDTDEFFVQLFSPLGDQAAVVSTHTLFEYVIGYYGIDHNSYLCACCIVLVFCRCEVALYDSLKLWPGRYPPD